ncbi:acyl-CoA dehydrogenase family member 11-like [Stegodyphus dumicola]|uniref:acyl-CoA dehydrogenase family member 11-like n=1 Tax=Stegodyphus dumicola TaxID=202533 RepID=UPI0015A93057|nr:acyl-CoA dehydrogenase family member 11-like [Stegodyphus dumicola]
MYRYSLRKVLSQRKPIVIPCDETFSTCNCLNQRVCSSLSEANKNVKINENVKPNWIPFSQAKQGEFYQQKPKLDNPFLSDLPLRRFLDYHVPSEVKNEISKDLENFGSRIVHEIDNLGWECELNLPYLRTQDAWGVRVDELITCSAWQKQRDISAEEGLIAIAYKRELHYWSRLHQICKLYLYSPSSGLYSCPVAMTDGAAKTIESLSEKRELFQKAYNYLTCRDPTKFWTSGQWMTERRGGSDVANGTETIAIQDKDEDFFHLYGYKWFTSAADSNMALTLARQHPSETSIEGKKGLTLFYLETRNEDGKLNNMQLVRLKNKLGTRQLPTAEILLDGSIAYKMSETGAGISVISHMLNITRLHNAVSAISYMRR